MHCFKRYIKRSFMCQLPRIRVSWMFEKWTKTQCSAAPHSLAFSFMFKIQNCCTSLSSVEQRNWWQKLLRLLLVPSHAAPRECRDVPGKTNRFIAFHLAHWQCVLTSHHVLFSTTDISLWLCHAQLSAAQSNLVHFIFLGFCGSEFGTYCLNPDFSWGPWFFPVTLQCLFTASYTKYCRTAFLLSQWRSHLDSRLFYSRTLAQCTWTLKILFF